MQHLVTIDQNQMITTSLLFAKEFGLNHNDLIKKIVKLTEEVSSVKPHFIESTFKNKRGRTYPMYKMTRDGFMFLVMNTNAKGVESRRKIFTKQLEFINAFNEMESLILDKIKTESDTFTNGALPVDDKGTKSKANGNPREVFVRSYYRSKNGKNDEYLNEAVKTIKLVQQVFKF